MGDRAQRKRSGTAENVASTTWLRLGRASQLLGVNQTTLRRWTDEGKVKVFLTPGGHRRFAEEDLRRMLQGTGQMLRPSNLIELIQAGYQRYLAAQKDWLCSRAWYRNLDEQHKVRFRKHGRRYIELLSEYLSHKRSREHSLREGHRLGEEYGTALAQLGLSASEAIESFLFFRSPVLNAVVQSIRQNDILNQEQMAAILEQTNRFIDELLLATAESYQRNKEDQPRPEGAGRADAEPDASIGQQ
ncbi:MAG: helix-turn-helix domain-containing protein [Chloroflexi bacterium]|nr:helix-turn-helix domain-containing protein [Chloroflexota bacterium]MCL5075371.1 helix-turn-helix domain-containing protein [Chloroflexota bacterium]